jgi:hypothetical protein
MKTTGRHWSALILGCLLLDACAPSHEAEQPESGAGAAFESAEALERDSLFAEAAAQYAAIAEQFPTEDTYGPAVRRAAFLYARPDNRGRNDTLALRWLRIYRPLAHTGDEQREIDVFTALIEQNIELRGRLAREAASIDSLEAAQRRQIRRVRDLEAELRQVNDALKKLKEVDVGTARGRKK